MSGLDHLDVLQGRNKLILVFIIASGSGGSSSSPCVAPPVPHDAEHGRRQERGPAHTADHGADDGGGRGAASVARLSRAVVTAQAREAADCE